MKNRPVTLSDFELGWLVGILEGEGCFDYSKRTQAVYITSTDEDTIEMYVSIIAKIVGIEVPVQEFAGRTDRHKMNWRVSLTGDNARKVMRLVVPYMRKRRRAKIWQCLNEFRAPKLEININQLMENIHARSSAIHTGGRCQDANGRNRNADPDDGPEGDHATDFDDADGNAEPSQPAR